MYKHILVPKLRTFSQVFAILVVRGKPVSVGEVMKSLTPNGGRTTACTVFGVRLANKLFRLPQNINDE